MSGRMLLIRFALCFTLSCGLWSLSAVSQADDAGARVHDGLQVLYDFVDIKDGIVLDRSDAGGQLDLKITDPGAVKAANGSLQVVRATTLRSLVPAKRLVNAVVRSGEISIEAWVRTRDVAQKGPARIVTLSKNSSERNFTLGQDTRRFDVRLRTTKTTTNGIPSTSSPDKSVRAELTHVVSTHSQNGRGQIYVNGKRVVDKVLEGGFSGWDRQMRLQLANEVTGDRPWLGTYHLVALYSRALSSEEVVQNFQAGPSGEPSPEAIAKRKHRLAARHFETVVAPILAKRCLECHDAATHESGLDLSKKGPAFRGGENGSVIMIGRAEESPLWASVESESMPHERAPLSAVEKIALKTWIDDGAIWTLDEIDPAIYAHHDDGRNYVRRLTVEEYIATVQATVGIDISEEARELLPPDLRADGFSNTAYNLTVDLKHVDAYSRLAEIVVGKMDVPTFVAGLSKRRKFTDKSIGKAISKIGEWLVRGPLSESELIAYRGVTTAVAGAGGDFNEAMAFVVEAMLQSPRFVYRVENQHGNGSLEPVDDYALASRMSYVIWGGPPDKVLLTAARDGMLDESGVRRQVVRMLKDPRAVDQSLRFVTDWLNLNRLANLRPNAKRFPQWSSELAEDMRQETLAFFKHVVWAENRPLSDLLNANVTFATAGLAEFYGLAKAETAVEPQSDDGLHRFDLSDVAGRGGLLTQGSLLTIGGDDASTVTRGLMVMHELLRGVVNDPPPCVDTTPVSTSAGLPQRSIAMGRIANPACGGCHSRFEPLAFGLTKFDGIGAYHDVDEHGNKLQDHGEILFPGTASPVRYKSAAELMNLLAASDRVSQSLTWKVTQFALGRPPGAEDAAVVQEIHRQAQANGGTWSAVLTAIIASDLIQSVRTEVSGD